VQRTELRRKRKPRGGAGSADEEDLSEYVVKASKAAAKHKCPLKITGAVRDVAATHGSVWPEEQRGSGVNVFGQAVVITDEQIADLRRLARLRGDDVNDG
jgi:hypothetical protein